MITDVVSADVAFADGVEDNLGGSGGGCGSRGDIRQYRGGGVTPSGARAEIGGLPPSLSSGLPGGRLKDAATGRGSRRDGRAGGWVCADNSPGEQL